MDDLSRCGERLESYNFQHQPCHGHSGTRAILSYNITDGGKSLECHCGTESWTLPVGTAIHTLILRASWQSRSR